MQITKNYIDKYTVSSVLVKLLFQKEEIGHATGFFWQTSDRLYFVSNWHVFSGRDPWSGQPKHGAGALPTHLGILIHVKDKLGEAIWHTASLRDENNTPLWKEHAIFGRSVDVAVMEVPVNLTVKVKAANVTLDQYPLNRSRFVDDMLTAIGSDVFVIGFPFGLQKQGPFPIWKRGSIATEFGLDVDQRPCFLIDTATREGMSGSPVLLRKAGGYTTANAVLNLDSGIAHKFLGVYSGRYVGNLHEAHLGIVWKPSTLEDIISNGVVGRPEL